MCSLLLLLTISSQPVINLGSIASTFHLCLSSSLLSYNRSVVETMPWKFQGFFEGRSGSSEKDRYFMKISKWQHKLILKYKRRKLTSYFLDNAAKTCSYGLSISENIEIKHVFQSKLFFHHSNFLHTSRTNAYHEI